MRLFDFSSWQSIGTTLLGLCLVTLIGVGIRLMVMMTIQQRRERMNRQINERLRTLIAAYKTLGGSFTGNLMVDPRHLRDIRRQASETQAEPAIDLSDEAAAEDSENGESDRPRRIRDAVEAALSDIILLGTEPQVRLASRAAQELAGGRPVHVHDLVVELRDFIRKALDLDPVPADVIIPAQGPTRPSGSSGKGGGRSSEARAGGGGGRGGGGGGMGMAGGLGIAGGASLARGSAPDEAADISVDPQQK
ncbi:hypothetical protein SKP52_04625 [Sphingopyxis fribergensis]|uniref:Uncharacterized protein n=1 Tax=Sphingopyxis fribergensis TaxID=1515612 RepID=A0A0A7PIU8_9SPHN|nr:hypothetical protein [Sphingopyxis fribergensis]AJA07852.1 hypothetical protein SKP52_04625 [Sphingopyxis fribergensis]